MGQEKADNFPALYNQRRTSSLRCLYHDHSTNRFLGLRRLHRKHSDTIRPGLRDYRNLRLKNKHNWPVEDRD